jgi:hypothetical protein
MGVGESRKNFFLQFAFVWSRRTLQNEHGVCLRGSVPKVNNVAMWQRF